MNSITTLTKEIIKEKDRFRSAETLKKLYSCLDLTNLNSFARDKDIDDLCTKAKLEKFKGIDIPKVAAVCVYPVYVQRCSKLLNGSGVQIATVSACFPHSQSYPEVKYLETEMAIKHGATEVDIVINVSAFLNGNESLVFDEIKTIKQICGNVHLKVILETDLLKQATLVKDASTMSLEAGADFIKTSTGKEGSVASLEAVYIMCNAIKQHYEKTGFKAGIKPAGGVSTADEALSYYCVLENILGPEWLNNKLFRIGASRLAGNLLEEIATFCAKKVTA